MTRIYTDDFSGIPPLSGKLKAGNKWMHSAVRRSELYDGRPRVVCEWSREVGDLVLGKPSGSVKQERRKAKIHLQFSTSFTTEITKSEDRGQSPLL